VNARLAQPAAPPDPASLSDRAVCRAALLELARRDPRIVCIDTDMGGLETGFALELPGQYLDLGIAEANAMTVAAGMARTGLTPWVNTMATFAAARAYEQVKVDIAYHRLPVRIVASHSGLSAAHLGPTHHAQHDLAAMRLLPNMTVMTPADTAEAARMVEAAALLPGPVYIRLGSRPVPPVYRDDHPFEVGRAVELRSGDAATIAAAGPYPVLFALAAADLLAGDGLEVTVLNVHTLKPLDVEALAAAAARTGGVVTVEDHSVLGGLGGAVAEALSDRRPTPVRRIGVGDVFWDRAGTHAEMLEACGVTPVRIAAAARAIAEMRRCW
jgi:transketolase